MAKLHRLFVALFLVISLPILAQSADQELLSAIDSPDPVIPGNNVTYTVQVRNNGPDPAVNGGLNMNIGGSLTYISASGPAGFTCGNIGNNASCTNPSFPSGTTATFTVIAQLDPSRLNFPDGTVTSNFFTSGVTADPNNGNNSASVNTAWDSPQVDLSLTVSDSPDPVFPNGNITYTIPVTNAGPDTATSVNFNSFNNGTLKFQSATTPPGWNCTLPAVNGNPTFTCSTPSFAPSTVNFTVVMKADPAILGVNDGTVSSVFSVNGTGDDTNDPNNVEQEDTAYVTADADMAVSVTDSPDPVFPNGTITYTVQASNNGPDAAPSATVSMFNNGTLKYQSATVPAGWNCPLPAVNATPTFTCTNPSFANGASSTFTFVVLADPAVLGINDGTVSSVFSAGSAVADPNNANTVEQEDTAYVTPDADISVTNSDSPDPVTQGGTITYTQSIANGGPDAAPNAQFAEVLPSSVGFQSISVPAGFNCTTPAVGASGNITCTNPSFASGASGTITLVVNVIASSGTVGNTIVGGSNVQDPDGLDNTATVSTTIIAPVIADLGITKTGGTGSAAAGSIVAYTITLVNDGPDTAANVVVSDVLPAELLFQSITVPAGFNCTTPAVGTNGTVTCTAATFPSGSNVTFTLVVQVTGNAVGPINNNATASSTTGDNNSGNNSGSAAPITVGSNGTSDLSVDKSSQTTTAGPGDSVTYTIVASNAGPNPATSVVVTDTLPASLLFQSITPAAGFTCTTPAAGTTGTITCTGGTIPNGATATFTLVTTISPSATGTVANGVTVGSANSDPNSGNSSDISAPIVVATADLSIAKTTASSTAPNGSTISYTITVTNNGPDAAANVVVSDNLPAGLQFVSAVPSQGTCSGSDPFTCNLGGLAASASATITLQALVTATSGTISNTATVTASTDDNNPGNNSSSSPAIPVTPGGPAPSEAAIPTLSEWALLALVAMLGAVAVRKMT
jgi:uncharacterized repeat protein (TIGR01451 family)